MCMNTDTHIHRRNNMYIFICIHIYINMFIYMYMNIRAYVNK